MRILPRTRRADGARRISRLRPRRPEERSAMPLLDHLEELRGRLVWSLGAVALASIAGWALFDRVTVLLLDPARPYLHDLTDGQLIFTGPLEAFGLRFKVATYIGFGLAFPVILFHLWRFVSPGLHKRERRYAIPFIAAGILMFATGVTFASYTMPSALRFLIGEELTGPNVSPLLSAKSYLGFALMYHVAFGLAFQLPVFLMGLSMLRIVNSRQMAKYRRHVLMGITVAAAVLTPSVDWLTMGVLTAAMYILYESCIWLSRLLKR